MLVMESAQWMLTCHAACQVRVMATVIDGNGSGGLSTSMLGCCGRSLVSGGVRTVVEHTR